MNKLISNHPAIAVVIPCYRSRNAVLSVLQNIPAMVSSIYCIDDACPEETGRHIEAHCTDIRVKVLYHEANLGVGGAVITGYRQAIKDGADIIVKIDSDGQMDPALIPKFAGPIIAGAADYTKGNRFYSPATVKAMPTVRLLGNAALSFLTKLSSGYWQIFDPTNGFTAIHATVARLLPLERISADYFFESDMLFRLNTVRAVVMDIPHRAIYADETSNLKIKKIIPVFILRHLRNFMKRIVYNYFLRDFHAASLEWLLGPAMLVFSLIFGTTQWIASVDSGESASAGTVMLAALPLIIGLQLTLAALHFDIQNQPKTPIHKVAEDILA